MSGHDDEFERQVREMVARQPETPEIVIRVALRNRFDRIRREQAQRERIGALAEQAGTSWSAAAAAIGEQERREADAKWRADVDAATRLLAGAGTPTPLAREKIPQVRAAAAALRRGTKHGASVRAVARRVDVDRGTLKAWIDRGWVSLDTE